MNLITILWGLVALVVVAAVAVRAIGGNIRLVSDWKLSYQYYSTYGYLLLAFLPEFWNELLAMGLFEGGDGFSQWESIAIKAVTVWTALTQKLKQVEPPPRPDFDGDGKPG